jgi:hypothetical protein
MKVRTAIAIALFGFAFSPLVAAAQDQDGQQACMSDAQAYCGQFIPDRVRVHACLVSNPRTSSACRVALRSWR